MHKSHIALKQKLDEAQAIINEMMAEEPSKIDKGDYLNMDEDKRAEYDKEQLKKKDKPEGEEDAS